MYCSHSRSLNELYSSCCAEAGILMNHWQTALSSLNSRLAAAENETALDAISIAASLTELQELIEQHRTVLGVAARGSCVRRWFTAVRLRDADLECKYQAWEQALSTPTLKACQTLVGVMLVALMVNQALQAPLSRLFVGLYTAMAVTWLTTCYLVWRRQSLAPWWASHAIAVLNTANGVLIFVSSMLCSESPSSAQCATLAAGQFNATHLLAAVTLLCLHSMIVQVPWLVLHMALLFGVWWGMFIGQFPGLRLLVPACFCVLVAVTAAQVHAKHVMSRLQFHLVAQVSQQAKADRQAMVVLDEAHEEATREVRAAAVRDTNASIMGYICHQLRNPLHSLSASMDHLQAHWVEGAAVTASDRAMLEVVDQSVHQLSRVVDDVWDFQELQQGVAHLNIRAVAVRAIIATAVHPLQAAGHAVDSVVTDDLPEELFTDSERVAQLLTIGLSNAVKHKAAGSVVHIMCALREPAMLYFEVSNEGAGLGTLDVGRAFDPCCSLGLGLPLSKLIVQLLGGQVGLEDRGARTVFWFTIHATSAPHEFSSKSSQTVLTASDGLIDRLPGQLPPILPAFPFRLREGNPWSVWGTSRVPPVAVQAALRVLVVDDLKANRLLLSAMLSRLGHAVVQLEDGDQVRCATRVPGRAD